MANNPSAASAAAGQSSLIFLGTGCSSTVPDSRCLLQAAGPPCAVCSQSLTVPPELNPNYRTNVSLLIDVCRADGGGDEHRYILIDAGKTFREQVHRWFVRHRIPRVDAVLLTHEHADAVLGIDDLYQMRGASTVPICCTKFTMDSVWQKFAYLKGKKAHDSEADAFEWRTVDADAEKPFEVLGFEFIPLPVMHGEGYVCLGFLFGTASRGAYFSDVSRFPPETESVISKSGGGQLDLLILDANSLQFVTEEESKRRNHLSLHQSLAAIKRIHPKKALLVGMRHDCDHDKINAELTEWSTREGIPVQLAHDGLRIFMDL